MYTCSILNSCFLIQEPTQLQGIIVEFENYSANASESHSSSCYNPLDSNLEDKNMSQCHRALIYRVALDSLYMQVLYKTRLHVSTLEMQVQFLIFVIRLNKLSSRRSTFAIDDCLQLSS